MQYPELLIKRIQFRAIKFWTKYFRTKTLQMIYHGISTVFFFYFGRVRKTVNLERYLVVLWLYSDDVIDYSSAWVCKVSLSGISIQIIVVKDNDNESQSEFCWSITMKVALANAFPFYSKCLVSKTFRFYTVKCFLAIYPCYTTFQTLSILDSINLW